MASKQGQRPWLGTRRGSLVILIAGGWAAAIVVVALLSGAAWLLLESPRWNPPGELSPRLLGEVLRIAFAVVAGLGGTAFLVIAYRRQRSTERGEQREDTKLFTERFTTAVSQIGEEQPAVRLGGVHALAHLADDAHTPELRQMCIDVLCAYLRMPFEPEPHDPGGDVTADERKEIRARRLEFAALREVRTTIVRIIGRRLRTDTPWRLHDYDFTGVVFDRCNFSRTVCSGRMVFTGAEFTGDRVAFVDAVFSGDHVSFSHATFSADQVRFDRATFPGPWVSFAEVTFSGEQVHFDGARFPGEQVRFDGATFSGKRICFADVTFSADKVHFDRATFPSDRVSFVHATFSGDTVDFTEASAETPTPEKPPEGLLEAADRSPAAVNLRPSWIAEDSPPP